MIACQQGPFTLISTLFLFEIETKIAPRNDKTIPLIQEKRLSIVTELFLNPPSGRSPLPPRHGARAGNESLAMDIPIFDFNRTAEDDCSEFRTKLA
jgi:hypothetical protein